MKNQTVFKRMMVETGYSRATISNVFNNKPHVRETVRQKILAAAQRLNYAPRYTMQKARIAIVLPAPEEIYMAYYETRLLSVISRYLFQRHLPFDIVSDRDLPYVSRTFLRGGVVIRADPQHLEAIKNLQNFPLVFINPCHVPCHCVRSDHAQGARLAMGYLVRHGHRRIGVTEVIGPNGAMRMAAYRQAVAALRLDGDPVLIHPLKNSQALLEAFSEFFRRQVTAVIVCGENFGLPATYYLNILGKCIPEDVSIISFESQSVSSMLWPPHTTLAQNLDAMGVAAVDKLLDLLEGREKGLVNVAFEETLIERKSVAAVKPGAPTGPRRHRTQSGN